MVSAVFPPFSKIFLDSFPKHGILVVYHWDTTRECMTKTEVLLDLQQRIISEEFLPGAWLVERDLSSEYGLSRTPIREVLNKLVLLGLITVQQNRGYQVRQFSFQDVVEIFNARRAIEGACARYACFTKAPDIDVRIQELRAKLLGLDIDKDGGSKAIAVGNEVHDYLIELAGNRYLKEFTYKLSSLMKLTRNLTKNRTAIEENSRQDHLKILDALEKRDADLCEQLMDQHLSNTCKALADTYLTSLTSFYA